VTLDGQIFQDAAIGDGPVDESSEVFSSGDVGLAGDDGSAALPYVVGDRLEAVGSACPDGTPRSASRRAVASPIPLLAPVIATTLFVVTGIAASPFR